MDVLIEPMIAWLEQRFGKMTDRYLNLDGLQVGQWQDRPRYKCSIAIVFRPEGPHFLVLPSWPCQELQFRWADPKLFDKLETVIEDLERQPSPEIAEEFMKRIRESGERSL